MVKVEAASPKVYSYIRFSTPEQALGDSERRQLKLVREFAKKKNLPFDESLRLSDRGLSGYHGHHRKKGVLGKFLLCVENGTVPQGSVLVVENIDRLSREGAYNTLREIIFKLWDKKIILQTLSPEESYPPGCDNEVKFLALLLYIQRAYDESLRKSERVIAARNTARTRARTEKKILTARCPAWLKVVDGKFRTIPEAVEAVKMIFDLKQKGIGKGQIAKKLNSISGWMPPKGNGWRESYIQKILQNPAVIGQYQPYALTQTGEHLPVGEPIEGYYPVVISPETFYAVQEVFQQNKGKGGKTGKAKNLFQNLVKCPYCGGSMVFIDKGKPPKGSISLQCDNGRRGHGCSAHKMRYDEVEELILNNCKKLKPEQILPNPDEQTKLCDSIKKRIDGNAGKLQAVEKRIGNFLNQLGDVEDTETGKLIKSKIKELQEQAVDIKSLLEADKAELGKAQTSLQSLARWKKDLCSLQEAVKQKDAIDIRMRLQAQLKEFIEKVQIYSNGFSELYDFDKDNKKRAGRVIIKDGKREIIRNPQYINSTESIEAYCYDVISEANPQLSRSKEFQQFVEDLVKRRMSKEGRFVRVMFRTGAFLDLVPDGGLATGKDKNGLPVEPAIGKMFDDWKKEKRK